MLIPVLSRIYKMVDHAVIMAELVQIMGRISDDVTSKFLALEQEVISKNRQYLAYPFLSLIILTFLLFLMMFDWSKLWKCCKFASIE